MTHQNSRRQFLRGRFQAAPGAVMRAPGAVADAEFFDRCTGCGDCVQACPEAILATDDHGGPAMQVNQGACTFCGDCIQACDTGALDASVAWTWRARIAPGCLSMNGVQCRTCQDHCDRSAIGFTLQPGGCAAPRIDLSACNGCGGCVAPCPVDVIGMYQPSQSLQEAQPC